MATVPGDLQAPYQVRSKIALARLRRSQGDPGRNVTWVNAICAAFLATGIIGAKAPLDPAPRTRLIEEAMAVPVDYVPPAVPAPPELSEASRDGKDTPIQEGPAIEPLVALADAVGAPAALPVPGGTITPRAIRQASALPVRAVAVASPSSPNVGPRSFRAGDGAGEGIVAPLPEYPIEARRRGLEGMVKLEIDVDEAGNILDVRKLIPSGSFLLDNNTITWVKRRWKFPPGKRQVLHTEFVYQLSDGR